MLGIWGDEDTDGLSIASDALKLNSGTINAVGSGTAVDLGTHAFTNDADRNGDGQIDFADFLIFAARIGATGRSDKSSIHATKHEPEFAMNSGLIFDRTGCP